MVPLQEAASLLVPLSPPAPYKTLAEWGLDNIPREAIVTCSGYKFRVVTSIEAMEAAASLCNGTFILSYEHKQIDLMIVSRLMV